jgi:hypothetical protein
MARETTRRVNRQVVEALEEGAVAAERAALEWNLVLSRMTVLEGLTPLHKDLVDDAWSASAKLGDYRENLLRRLRAERDGEGR